LEQETYINFISPIFSDFLRPCSADQPQNARKTPEEEAEEMLLLRPLIKKKRKSKIW
jgi:hypothetical protein